MGKKEIVYKVYQVVKFIKFGLPFCFINFITLNCSGQSDSGFIRKGILRAAGTFAFGTIPENNITDAYLTGNLEYYAEKKISIRGDVYYFLNSTHNIFNKNDALYFGAYYHIPTNSHFDPVIGLQPGISYTQVLVSDNSGYGGVYPDVATICPLASAVVGFNLFGEKWFHIQLNVRYTIGEHLTVADETNISELSINFGLGFNLNLLSTHAK
jgi:hypothetical protein